MPSIIITLDGVIIRQVRLTKERTRLGRRPYNDVVIDNPAVSGEHAVLHLIGSDVYLEDLHSTNGTYVNARAIQRHALEHDDLIGIARYKIRYLAGDTPVLQDAPADGFAPSAPQTLSGGITQPATLPGTQPLIRILSGRGAGGTLALRKVVTAIGQPGVAVAAVTRRQQGYVVAPVDGDITLLNGQRLGDGAVALHHGDVLELGGTRLQFVHA